ncbi:FAD dependent oxidoreductase superfamily [Karstenula rhodostoma CBS 690.94]|uniref:Amine oxidase n=1 Tax=Karstenula rhodostoma CBS 690.94 TaxID=1392251 RepID=A0A9P4PZ89_9PLEO|nr:FAD dependent oxidoreductase superfamily [Karstenula rhodostoma CBS 690.94]
MPSRKIGNFTLLLSTLATSISAVDVITRDVVIIGGGAAGSHAAVWLRDHNKTVAVVERSSQLGGHTAVYHHPSTGAPINIGVQAWMEYLNTTSFPHRMGVDTNGSMQFEPLTKHYIDFTSGLPVSYAPPSPAAEQAALSKYLSLCEKHASLMLPGFFNFPAAGADIPEDLTMDFSAFVQKYSLQAAVPRLWDSTVMGVGDFLRVPTLYVMQASGLVMARAMLGQSRAIVPSSGNLHELYERVADLLGGDVQYDSIVVGSSRNETDVEVWVKHRDGIETVIVAKRLLVAFEPSPVALAPFDLDDEEADVLGKLRFSSVYAGLVQHPSLEGLQSWTNTVPGAVEGNFSTYPLPAHVGRIAHQPGGGGRLFSFTAVGNEEDGPESIQALIAQSVENMVGVGTVNATNGTTTFPYFANHGLMHSRVSGEELRKGFIARQTALQGRRATWYTGAAFSSGFSTVLWAYNEVLLPRVIEGL